MGSLAHLTGGIDKIRTKLEQADAMGLDLSDLLGKKFDDVNSKLEKNLNTLITQANQSQNTAFSTAVQQAVLNITQSQQIMLNSNLRVLQELVKLKEELSEEVGEVKSGVGSVNESLASQIENLAKSVEKLPTRFPEQKDVDLSEIVSGIKNLYSSIKAIPVPEMPKQKDIAPLFKNLEKKLSKRVHTFEIERANDLIKKIVVTTK